LNSSRACKARPGRAATQSPEARARRAVILPISESFVRRQFGGAHLQCGAGRPTMPSLRTHQRCVSLHPVGLPSRCKRHPRMTAVWLQRLDSIVRPQFSRHTLPQDRCRQRHHRPRHSTTKQVATEAIFSVVLVPEPVGVVLPQVLAHSPEHIHNCVVGLVCLVCSLICGEPTVKAGRVATKY
jgi:hypothetical protein